MYPISFFALIKNLLRIWASKRDRKDQIDFKSFQKILLKTKGRCFISTLPKDSRNDIWYIVGNITYLYEYESPDRNVHIIRASTKARLEYFTCPTSIYEEISQEELILKLIKDKLTR